MRLRSIFNVFCIAFVMMMLSAAAQVCAFADNATGTTGTAASTTQTTLTLDTASDSSTGFATGALEIKSHGAVATLVGYSGIITNTPSWAVGSGEINLTGFIGAGATTTSGGTTFGFGLEPVYSIGSLNLGVGVFVDTSGSGMSLHPMVSAGFNL
jgi:hypothetical protein